MKHITVGKEIPWQLAESLIRTKTSLPGLNHYGFANWPFTESVVVELTSEEQEFLNAIDELLKQGAIGADHFVLEAFIGLFRNSIYKHALEVARPRIWTW